MRVNPNLNAIVANNRLHVNENMVEKSMERLTSGLKIVHASDDPSGMALSERIDSEVKGVGRAGKNTGEATSMIRTADGVLNEMTAMIQRMRELAVQAANDTNTPEERSAIEQEVTDILNEMDRMSGDSEFNRHAIFNGEYDNKVLVTRAEKQYIDSEGNTYKIDEPMATRIEVSDDVDPGKYTFSVRSGSPGRFEAANDHNFHFDDASATNILGANYSGKIMVNGFEIGIDANDTKNDVFEKVREACEFTGSTLDVSSGKMVITAKEAGPEHEMKIQSDNANLRALLGINGTNKTVIGTDAKVTLITKEKAESYNAAVQKAKEKVANGSIDDPEDEEEINGLKEIESSFLIDEGISTRGNRVTIRQPNGFEMSFLLDEGINPVEGTSGDVSGEYGQETIWVDEPNQQGGATGIGHIIFPPSDIPDDPFGDGSALVLDVTDIGRFQVQHGNYVNQLDRIGIPVVNTKYLYLDNIGTMTHGRASEAIAALDEALNRVNAIRSRLGAYENRMDQQGDSLDKKTENLTTALSRIRDLDMAEEMTNYTSANVLVQAAQSVLAQANDLPESVLQIIK